jgi:deoxyadenosine kinase
METTITLEYLTNLRNAYDRFLNDISRVIPVIKVDWSSFQDPEKVAEMIKSEWQKMQNIHEIDFKGPQI